jgi:hypothetical protein
MQSKRLMAVFFAVVLFIAGIAGPASTQQFGLVNVSVGDVELLNNAKIGVAIPVVANICPNVNANVVVAAILAVAGGESDQEVLDNCTATGAPVTITQAD